MMMDDADLRAAFKAHTEGQTRFTRRMAITLADMNGETPRGLVLRLERMGLLKAGSWEWFTVHGGIKPDQILEVRRSNALGLPVADAREGE
jgi:hypothetical protein